MAEQVDPQQIDEVLEELEDEIELIGERLREINNHHEYQHALGMVIRRLIGHTTDPSKEGQKCSSSTLAAAKQMLDKMTVELENVPPKNQTGNKDLNYIG